MEMIEGIITGWPRCDKCNKGVDRVITKPKDFPRNNDLIIIAECHGAQEQTEFTEHQLLWAEPGSIVAADAFVGKLEKEETT